MTRIWRSSLVRSAYGGAVQGFYYGLAFVQAPILLAFEKVLPVDTRKALWRNVSYLNSQMLYALWGLKIKVDDRRDGEGPFVYMCNHPSAFDGFTCFGLVGPNVTMLTGPRKMFPYPFNFWFKKTGAIDVMRDWYDDEHFKDGDSTPRQEAIEELVRRAKSGESVFLFGEGHIERSGRLQYIHTGAARVAIKAGVPLVPMSLVGEQKLISKHQMRPGKLKVVFGEPIHPPKVSTDKQFRKAVIKLRDHAWKMMREQLPHRYQRDFFNEGVREDVGVFVDIDGTIYKGYSMKDFFRWLIRKGHLSKEQIRAVEKAVFLNATNVLSHAEMMEGIAKSFAGWKQLDLQRYAREFYEEEGYKKYNHHLLGFMKDHQECKHRLVIISETIQPLAECFRDVIGAEEVFGSKMEVRNGVYTGKILRLMRDKEKRSCAQVYAQNHDLNIHDSFAYADSMSDLPMFRLVGHPVVVDPHNSALSAIAKKRHWEMIH